MGGVIRLALTYDYIRLQKILGKRILVYIGNISENKNQIQAVRVMKQVENAVLFVVGTEADGGVVRNYVQENDLYGRVVLTGFSDDVAQIWENVDLNLFFSKNDGFGLSVIEGYMYGVPSVMFADLDAAEDVYYPHLMLLVNDRSDDSAANAIRQGMSKEWDKDIIKTYAKRFSMRNIARTYDDFYRKSIVAEKL